MMKVRTIKKNGISARMLAAVMILAVFMMQFFAHRMYALAADDYIMMNIKVYYNDAGHDYYGFDTGEQVKVFGEGTYTLTFDCTKNLSADAKSAEVKSLTNIGAIYLIDDEVDSGRKPRSNVSSFEITYNSIVVDGKELTIIQTEPINAIKSSGAVDTNGPINAWDGSLIAEDEYTVSENVFNFTGMEEPKVITITFTVSNMYFKGSDVPATTDPNSVTTEADTTEEDTTADNAQVSGEDTVAAAQTTANQTNDGGSNIIPVIVVIAACLVLVVVLVIVAKKMKKSA